MKKLYQTFAIGLLVFLMASPAFALDQKPVTATRITVEKSHHLLTIYAGDQVLRTYQVALGSGGLEPKKVQGDKRAPEGKYVIDSRNENSSFHKSLHISYPNNADIKNAAKNGVNPGGDIMIHGIRNGMGWIGSLHRLYDWTAGCIAVTDDEIEEIWKLVPDGTPVEITK